MLIVISLDALLKKYTENLPLKLREGSHARSVVLRSALSLYKTGIEMVNGEPREFVGGEKRKRKMRGFLCAVLTDWKFEFN